MRHRSYSELRRLSTFEERFDYLAIRGEVGAATFGFDRWINQVFYHSWEWKQVRDVVIVRDDGCDLGIPGREVWADILVHHMNPVTPEDIDNRADWILDPEFLITTTRRTHNAIHYGNSDSLPRPMAARKPGDTNLW